VAKKPIGNKLATEEPRRTWVQTERSSHEVWAVMIAKAPTAARLMHILTAHMGPDNALVASQTTLGELMRLEGRAPVHRHTIRKAIQHLEKERWLEVVQLGGKGGALAYVVNSRVGWTQSRNQLHHSRFSAQIVASGSEQTEAIDNRPPLRQVPTLMRGEVQVPAGNSAPPPSQGMLEGMEPDLPAIMRDDDGREWQVDQQTGEVLGLVEPE